MNTQRKHAAVLAVLFLVPCLADAPASAQIAVEEAGRAFDAPGSSNSANNPTGASLANPYSPSAAGSISADFRLNQFNVNTNLPTLSAGIDPNNFLTIRSTAFNPGANRGFDLQGAAGSLLPVIQPYGLPTSYGSPVRAQPSFAAPPLAIPNGTPSSTGRGAFPGAFGLGGSSLPSTLPQFSAPAGTFPNSLQTTLDGAISNLDQILYNTAYDIVELNGGSLPSSVSGLNTFAPSVSPKTGLIETNFGFTPGSGTFTTFAPDASTDAGDFQLPIRPISELPSIPTFVQPQKDQTGGTSEHDIYNSSLIGDSLIQRTLEDAWRTTPANGTTSGDFTLPQSPAADGDSFRPRRAVYAEMKQSIQRIKQLRAESANMGLDRGTAPGLSDAYDRALSFVRSTEQEPISSFVSDGIDATQQIARKAERYLKTGAYYRALTSYDVALVTDRDNPLLLLGQGHALIGSGEYYGAVRKIAKAIEHFPEIAYFKLDLNKFITDANLLDVRRADLETRLAERDDYRLRFLLGYIEYYIGLPEFGVEDLKAAAKAAPEGSAIARFPQMLELGDTLRMP